MTRTTLYLGMSIVWKCATTRGNQTPEMQFIRIKTLLDRRISGSVVDRIHRIVELELEVLSQLLANRRLHRLEHILKHTKVGRVFHVVVATLEHTGANQASVPSV